MPVLPVPREPSQLHCTFSAILPLVTAHLSILGARRTGHSLGVDNAAQWPTGAGWVCSVPAGEL